ncbi:MAG: MFS transporter [Firmicutes bacterium]|nr:MFS transporter [Bacillota bacterium]
MSDTHPSPSLFQPAFLLLCLVAFLVFMGFQMLMPTLPFFVEALGGKPAVVGLVTGSFTLAAVVARPWAGRLLDRHNRKKVYVASLGLFIACAALYPLLSTIALLIALRVVHGLSWAAIPTAGGTLAADLIPPQRRGEGMGYYGLASTLAMAFAPSVGLALIGASGHPHFDRLFVTATALAGIALVVLLLIRLPQSTAEKATPDDFRPQTSTAAPREAASGFWSGLLERSAFSASLVILLTNIAFGGVTTYVLLDASRLHLVQPGLFFFAFALSLMAARPLAGRFSDRYGRRAATLPALALLAVAMALLAWAGNLIGFLLAAVLAGIAFGSVQPAMQALAIEHVAPQRRGAANATFYIAFDLGITIGAMALGPLIQWKGYPAGFAACAFAALCALAGAWQTLSKPKPLPGSPTEVPLSRERHSL